MSLNGMPNNFETSYLYGDAIEGGLAGYYENIQVGGKITLATDETDITIPANNNSIGYNNEAIVFNVAAGKQYQYTYGGTQQFRIDSDALNVKVGSTLQRVAYDELVNVQSSRSNLQQQIDSLAPQGQNEFWGRAWTTTANQTTSGTNVPTNVFLYNLDNQSNGVQLSYPSPSVGLNIVYTGVYNITMTLEVVHPNNNAATVSVWFKNYGTNIANSLRTFAVTGGGAKNTIILTTTLKLTSGDRLETWWLSSDSGVYLAYTAAQTTPNVLPVSNAATIEILQISSFSVYYANVATEAAIRAEQQADYAANWAIQAQDAASTATIANTNANTAATNSYNYSVASGVYKNQAQAFAGDAITAKNLAVAAATDASNNKTTTETLMNQTFGYRNAAEGFKNDAAASANSANAYAVTSGGYRDQAKGYRDAAEGYKNNAKDYAKSASDSADASIAAAAAAGTAAVAAVPAATAAVGAAGTAGTAAGTATTAAGTATTAAGNAETAAGNAVTAKNLAEGYRDQAKGYRDESKGYRDQAKGYADEAGGFSNRVKAVEDKTQKLSGSTTGTVMLGTTTLGDPFVASANATINSTSSTFYGKVEVNSNGKTYFGDLIVPSNNVIIDAANTNTKFYNQVVVNPTDTTLYGNSKFTSTNITMGDQITPANNVYIDTAGKATYFYDKMVIGQNAVIMKSAAGIPLITMNYLTGAITCTSISSISNGFWNNWI